MSGNNKGKHRIIGNFPLKQNYIYDEENYILLSMTFQSMMSHNLLIWSIRLFW
jgi:hypothetical protein